MSARLTTRRIATVELSEVDRAAMRALLWAAFADDGPEEAFTEDDWQHALGGVHVVVEDRGVIIAHGSIVERELHVAGRPLRTGYVEAVATRPDRQATGVGTTLMTEINDVVRAGYELGALGTGKHHFYERLGWQTWRGPTFVRVDRGERRTPDEDGYILVLRTPATPEIDLDAPISCEWRPGDVW